MRIASRALTVVSFVLFFSSLFTACRGREERTPPLGPRAAAHVHTAPGKETGEPERTARAGGDASGGAQIYESRCASCHGSDGLSNTTLGQTSKAPRLADPALQKRLTDAELGNIVLNGKGTMPPVRLEPSSLRALVAHVRTLRR